ncbi:hypothetical protein FC679_20995 [Bacillus cereus]|uniref:Uncharacterized protein n=1 Tax=Bacillus thuringiensis TaxID=1428 RepID=A0A9X6Y774_BACTU|nr:hypothetical protein BVF97_20380 [Bacillus thuringiensis]PEA85805.1 hypothetical protein CON71_33735 [Bacillus thuringiensis]PRT27608.1 hypothetical protein C6351_17130 [Bacillus thuringiensis]TKH59387.1 hypothetical protein FC679_20995 [Bacillus cereus]TKH79835.1 hypothetical protein FC686_10300 [Bacillus cereus]
MGKAFNIIDLEEISTNRKDEVVEVLRLPFNRFPEAAGYIKDVIANGKTDICTIDENGLQKEENKL